MDFKDAAQRVLLGEALSHLAEDYRQDLIASMGLGDDDVTPTTFRKETLAYMSKLARHLGERHSGDARVAVALHAWCQRVEDYDAWDVLLSEYQFDGRDALMRRGKVLFPGPLTAHWEDRP